MTKNYIEKFLVSRSPVKIDEFDPDDTLDFKNKEEAQDLIEDNLKKLTELEYLLYAENKQSVLIILQGMDSAGKDGTIRHVMSALNPQNCYVKPFKIPSYEELSHDFLWRIHSHTPARGQIAIFNRSHYEDVLAVRVHNLVDKKIWSKRYEQINAFERLLNENRTTILKFYLHISNREQYKRLKERFDDKAKQWKISPADVEERKLWDKYVEAYNEVLSKCSTDYAPWFIIPSNKKWFRNLAISSILVETLKQLRPQIPKPSIDLSKIKLR